MNNLLAKHAQSKKLIDSILTIAQEAHQAKRENSKTINATIGMLFDEDGQLATFKRVKACLDDLSDFERFGYAPTDGGAEFKDAVLTWVLANQKENILAHCHVGVIATPGGSGAVSNTFSNYLNPGDQVVVSDIAWVYDIFAHENYLSLEQYRLFDESMAFNFEGLKEAIEKTVAKQQRILLVINDPCQNPTGFSLDPKDWKKIMELLNMCAEKGFPTTLLCDLAYMDYDPRGFIASRAFFEAFTQMHENMIAICAVSGSKTFSMYGMRLGAQIAISRNKSAIEAFFDANEHSARGKWSNIPHMGLALVKRMFGSIEQEQGFKEELQLVSKHLKERGEIFLEEAKNIGLKTFPYCGGFFILLPCIEPKATFNALKKDQIFVIPMKQGLRISLSAVSRAETIGLAQKIKQKIDEQTTS